MTQKQKQGRRMGTGTGTAALMAFFMLLYLAMALWSSVHLDMARDVRAALDVRDGLGFPLVGPVMAGHIHLGPVWYYLLALLGSLAGGWLGTVLLLALLCALQFPLAYLAGKEWQGRIAGWVWAALLLLPSWSTFEQFNPTHTQLTAPLLLAFVLCALRFCRRRQGRYLVGAAAALSLAIHAHPSTLAATPIALGVLGVALQARRQVHARHAVLAAAALVLPFLPWLWNEAGTGFASFAALQSYASSDNTRNLSLANALPLAAQVGWGGLQYWMQGIAQLPRWLVVLVQLVWAVLLAVGLAGALRASFAHGAPARLALALLVFTVLFIAAVRGYFPYYMTTVPRVLLCGTVAAGLAQVLGRGNKKMAPALEVVGVGVGVGMVVASVLLCSASYFLVLGKTAQHQRQGNWPFAFLPLFHVTHAAAPPRPLALMPAHAMQASGQLLCANPAQAMHGAYAVHLVHGYALEARFHCNRKDIEVGGSRSGAVHWLGAARSMLQAAQRKPHFSVGPFAFVPIRQLVHPAAALQVSSAAFPPIQARGSPETAKFTVAHLSENDVLAVSNLGFSFTPDPGITVVTSDGVLVQPFASDRTTHFYRCSECRRVDVQITSTNMDSMEVFIF